MMQSERSSSWLEWFYGRAILLYPRSFQELYGSAMSRAMLDAIDDTEFRRSDLLRLLAFDLPISLAKEHFAMLRDTLTRPALAFNAFVLAGISTVLALFLYAIPQQVLRQDANDPQLQLAADLAARLEQGIAPAEAVPAGQVDMGRSLAPFVIVYDDQGVPVASQAQLNGKSPAPPLGVFDYVRQHGEERLSWQPVLGRGHGVRIAAVVERVQRVGNGGAGFVLAGRSLAQVEAREGQVVKMAGLAWIAMLGLILAGTVGFGWWTRRAA
jgi:hypothetical protein